jgi:hypothetical protein
MEYKLQVTTDVQWQFRNDLRGSGSRGPSHRSDEGVMVLHLRIGLQLAPLKDSTHDSGGVGRRSHVEISQHMWSSEQ